MKTFRDQISGKVQFKFDRRVFFKYRFESCFEIQTLMGIQAASCSI